MQYENDSLVKVTNIVIALIAGFKPGTSPPPVNIAMVPFIFFAMLL